MDDSLTLRLGDSALASTLFPMDYHSFHGSSRLPVKWMSIEALEGGIYSSQSDVVKFLTQLTSQLMVKTDQVKPFSNSVNCIALKQQI